MTREEILDYQKWGESVFVEGMRPEFVHDLCVMALLYLDTKDGYEAGKIDGAKELTDELFKKMRG